ncbi:DNA polymerase III subunit delta [soil metagenome]
MPRTTYSKLVQQLRHPAGGVFFLSGDEPYLREEAVRQIVEAHLEPATRDFNLDQLRGVEASADALASLFATPPMMANWRLVVVRDAQGLTPKARTVVEAAAATPPAGMVLILSAAIPAGSQAAFYRTLERNSSAVHFPALGPLDAPPWATERAGTLHGVELELDAARALVAAVGTDLGTLAAEVDKLAGGSRDSGRITLADVTSLVGVIPRVNRWAWVELVGDRRLEQAMRQLPTLMGAGESGVALIIAIGAQLLRVALAASGGESALDRALPRKQPMMVRKLIAQARRWTLAELDAALAELLRTDRLLKTGPPSEAQAMEELLLRLRAIGAVAGARGTSYVATVPAPLQNGR